MKQKSKKFLILGLFLFGITLLLWNCTLEDNVVEPENINLSNVKTVSFKDAIANFNAKKEKITLKRTYSKGTKNQLEITPDWNTLEFNDIAYTDAKLTTANTEINRDGKYSSQLYFINVNNHIRNVIFTIYKDKMDDNGNVINGRIFFNDLNGKFLDGYIIENGVFTKRYIIENRNQTQKASFLPLFLFQTESDGIDYSCWVYSGPDIGEIVVTAYLQDSGENGGGSSSGGNEGGVYYTYGNSYGSYINGATSDGMNTNVGGGTSLSSGQVTSAAAAILMVAPIEPDVDGNCPDGYKKNPTTGKCESICTGGKYFNETSQKCECPEGMVEDDNGNCIKEQNPCDDIKTQISTSGADIKPIFENLKTKVDLPSEKGWSFMKTNTGYLNREIAVSVLDFNSVKPPTGGNIYGAVHTHTDQLHGMFSWSDIHVLFSLHKDAPANLKNSVFFYLVAQDNNSTSTNVDVYGITVDNFETLETKLTNDVIQLIRNDPNITDTSAASIAEAVIKINRKLGENYNSSADFRKTFLERFKNHGIKLYKANSDLTTFSELKLNEITSNVEEIPCE